MAANDELRGVLVQVADERMLLPNATVAEVLARMPVEPIPNAPPWLVGSIDWHGWYVPLVSFARLSGLANEGLAGNSKIVVLKTLGGRKELPYVALLTPSFPRLATVPRDSLLADASEDALPQGVLMRVLVGSETALLPDLDKVEAMVEDALGQTA